jgi:hypothetical protein
MPSPAHLLRPHRLTSEVSHCRCPKHQPRRTSEESPHDRCFERGLHGLVPRPPSPEGDFAHSQTNPDACAPTRRSAHLQACPKTNCSATWPIRVLRPTASGPARRTVPTSPPKWSGGDLRTRSVPFGLKNLRPRSDQRAEAPHSHFVARCRSIAPARRSRPPATSCTGLPHRPPKMLTHRLGCHSE